MIAIADFAWVQVMIFQTEADVTIIYDTWKERPALKEDAKMQ